MAQYTQEQLLAAYQRAPEPIQDAYGSEATEKVIDDVRTKYRLHVDVAANLDREVGYLMLGLVSPAEFFGSLMLSGTDEQTARGILQEINDRIFIPLKRQVMTAPKSAPPIASYVASTPPPQAPRPAPVSAPALEYEPKTPMLPGSFEPVPAPVAPAPEPPRVEAPIPAAVPVTPPTPSYVPPMAPQEPPRAATPPPSVKPYSNDPYREPV
ncbi:MAG TPA: hypothetical protein PK609_00795 [Candidatus Paceibacterota bacterium]|nr:hypothetical protein [Candidatus Paceibacterota bacterium]